MTAPLSICALPLVTIELYPNSISPTTNSAVELTPVNVAILAPSAPPNKNLPPDHTRESSDAGNESNVPKASNPSKVNADEARDTIYSKVVSADDHFLTNQL